MYILNVTDEYSKKRNTMDKKKRKVRTPQDVSNLVMDELKLETREIVKVIILNSQNVVIKIQNISHGGTNSANVDPKDLFAEAIKLGAPKIIMVHNHPSGNVTPSLSDIKTTNQITKAAKLLYIQVLDHIIYTRENCYSFADNGQI